MNGTETNAMTTQAKIESPQGGRSRGWQKLKTAGDVQRFLRFLILETKAGRIDVKKAAVLGQLGCYILRAVEVADLEERILRLEADQQNTPGDRSIRIFVGGKRDEIA